MTHKPRKVKGRFRNQTMTLEKRDLRDVFKWLTSRKPNRWPKKLHTEQQKIPVERVELGEISVTFINHSTFLLQVDGLNILTDPIWSKRAGPLGIIGPKRVRPPGVRFEDLPPIDIVLVSHNHYDHMDLPTLRRLRKIHDPLFIVSLGNRRPLMRKGFKNVAELDWWQSIEIDSGIKVTFVPAEHFARRGFLDHNRTLWGGFVLQTSSGAVYFAGDTGFGPHFEQIHAKFGNLRLALLPIGSYSPQWFMSPVHMGPEEAVTAHQILKASVSVGMHFGTFQLSDEAIDDPAKELVTALKKHRVPENQFWVLEPGEGRSVT